MWAPKHLHGFHLWRCQLQPMTSLRLILPTTCSFLQQTSHFLASTTSWSYWCSAVFTFTSSELPSKGYWAETDPVSCFYLASQTFYWSLDGSLHKFTMLAFCMAKKPPHRWCQDLPPPSCSPWIMAEAVWVTGCLKSGKYFHRWLWMSRVPKGAFSK